MASEKVQPRRLSHYTTLEGLMGIVGSKALWASNASYLNDKAELLHALSASRKAIRLLSSSSAYKTWEKPLQSVFSELRDGLKSDTYVTCFCTSDDNLSQWRGYGGDTQGVCLTFDQIKLSKRLKRDGAALYRVLYGRFSTAKKLQDELAGQLRDIAELDEILGGSSEKERHRDLLSRVSALLPKFKYLGFSVEREWRYVVQKTADESDIKFRVLKNKIVPYITVGAVGGSLPITQVRIGPGNDQDLTAKSVRGFLQASGYDVPVEISDIPFRP